MKVLSYNKVSDSILNIKLDKRTEVFNFGLDNAFPSLVEALLDISVTAKACVDKVAKAIYGGSFGEAGKVKVNSQGQTLNEVLRIAAREYAKHNNIFLQIGYDADLNFKSIVVIPVLFSRAGKDDDAGYYGKYVIYDNWDKTKSKKVMSAKFKVVDKFNKKKKVVRKQFQKHAEEDKDYFGQIIHIKKDTTKVYAVSDLKPVLGEALLEGNSQTFRSKGSEDGFLNTKLLGVQPFADDDSRKEFKKELNALRGAENSSDVLVVEATQKTEDLTKQIFLDDLSSPYNDKLFEYSDTLAEKNICKAFGVPLVLVNPSDSGLFGNSGAMLFEAKKQLFESREEDRNQIEEVFKMLMKNFKEPVTNLEIINPYEDAEEEAEEEVQDVNATAQATLRGSVGGVTALLAIQQSVAAKTTTKEAGISMIVNIYGYDKETASDMLGDPQTEPEQTES